jgi:WD40 repeat protein
MTDARSADAITRPTKDYDVFVVYADHDRAWVEGSLVVALRSASARVATRADIQPGEAWIEGLSRLVENSARQVIVASPAWHADNWTRLAALLGQVYGQQTDTWPVVPVIIEEFQVPLWLRLLNGLDATDPASRRIAVDRICRMVAGPIHELPTPSCPYPGMQPFDEEDAEFFYGRDAEIEEAVQRLRLNPRLGIIGPSGSGKSSLVHAGVVPRLRLDGWRIQRFRPGPRPVDTLRTATAGNVDDARSVVVVDQLEELFTLGAAQADEFHEEIAALATRQDRRLVVTLRADFYPQLMTSPLWALLHDHRLELLPLGGDALRRAIVSPAEKVEVFVESALVERLVADAAGEPGRLPLVQETLVLLWPRLDRRYLPLSAYDQLATQALVMTATSYGVPPRTGLHIALARHADATLAQIPLEGRALARRILLRLVQFGDGRADTRRPQPIDALRSEDDDPAVFDGVLRTLTTARLVTMTGTETAHGPVADLSHESIITAWPMFGEWITQRRVAEASRRRLQDKVAEWTRLGRSSGGLLDEMELAEAERYITGPDVTDLGVDPDLRQLVTTSRDVLEARSARQARSVRRFRRLAAGLAMLLIAAMVLGVVAIRQRDAAREQKELARSGELALVAVEGAENALGSALLLSREAVAIKSTPRTRSALLAVLQSQPDVIREMWGGSAVQALTSSPDRSRVAAGLRNGSVVVWDVKSGVPLFHPLQASGEPRSIAFSHDGRLVAVGSTDGTVVVWDAENGEQKAWTRDHTGAVRALSYSPDGTWLASGGEDNLIVIQPATLDGEPTELKAHTDWVNTLAFTPDSSTLISGAGRTTGESTDRRILQWPVTSPTDVKELGQHRQAVRALAVSPDGRHLASAGSDKLVAIWDLATGARRVLAGHTQRLYAVAFSPDGTLVASGGRDYDIRIWKSATGELVDTLEGRRTAVRGLAFVDSTTLISGANEATLRVWDLSGRTHPRLAQPITGQAGAIIAVTVSGDGHVTATAAMDNTVLIRDDTGDRVGDPIELNAPARQLALNEDGSVLATILGNGELQLWNTKSGASRARPVQTGDTNAVVALSSDGQRVATGGNRVESRGENSVVRLWDANLKPDGTSGSGEGSGHRSWVTGLAFLPDGQMLASSGAEGEVWLWDVSSDDLVGHRLNISTGQFTGIAVHADGDGDGYTIAAGDRDGRVLAWRHPHRLNPDSAADLVLLGLTRVGESPAPVAAVAFSPGGKLAAVAQNGAFALWELGSSPNELGRPVALGEAAYALAFAGNGGSLIVGVNSGASLWDMNLESWQEKACEVANRNLTRVELETYLEGTPSRRSCADVPEVFSTDTTEDVDQDEGD